jgi:phosphatidylserine/phosphatidylglycerophosphate/cardiolipin synthase-like enzyme
VKAIFDSKNEVVASVYSINNKRISEALIAAHKRGIKIRILTDRTQASSRSSLALDLIKAGVNLRVHSKYKIEHNKFGVFDNKLAVNGSYNWTRPATEENSENCAILPEANAVTAFKKRFEELWQLNTETKSKNAIAKIQSKKAERLPSSIIKLKNDN